MLVLGIEERGTRHILLYGEAPPPLLQVSASGWKTKLVMTNNIILIFYCGAHAFLTLLPCLMGPVY
jgi:hypothetical protein